VTRATNARLAGAAFLIYIAAGVTSMSLFGRAAAGADVDAKLASMAQHATNVRLDVLLTLLCALCAFVLAVTLHAITREQDPDLAMLGLVCRVAEGITGVFVARSLGLLWLASGPSGSDPAAARSLAAYLFQTGGWSPAAWLFSLGSACFCWLLLRGRMIPAALAWLGVVASILLVFVLPLELAGFVGRSGWAVWMPMLLFELAFAGWLLVKGAAPARRLAGGSL
jgi:hypothetical protein